MRPSRWSYAVSQHDLAYGYNPVYPLLVTTYPSKLRGYPRQRFHLLSCYQCLPVKTEGISLAMHSPTPHQNLSILTAHSQPQDTRIVSEKTKVKIHYPVSLTNLHVCMLSRKLNFGTSLLRKRKRNVDARKCAKGEISYVYA